MKRIVFAAAVVVVAIAGCNKNDKSSSTAPPLDVSLTECALKASAGK